VVYTGALSAIASADTPREEYSDREGLPMATATQISLEQYLQTPFEPDAEYVGGEIQERNMGENEHNTVQREILLWFRLHDKSWRTRTIQEQSTRFSNGNVRVPDVSVWKRDVPVQPVFDQPQLIAIEVLSPEDRHSRVQEKVEDYCAFQVPNIWVVDPIKRLGWDCSDGNWTRKERYEVAGSPIYLDLRDLFEELDTAES
jgi:Uma2 family endonuclease